MNQEIIEKIKEMGKTLKEKYGARRVILFGSYAKGEATSDSDVDLLVIAPTTERFNQRMATVLRLVRGLYHGIPLAPIVLSPEEVEGRRRIGDQFVEEILKKGVEI